MNLDFTKLIRRSKPAPAQAIGKIAYHAHLNECAEIVFAYCEADALALAKIEFGEGSAVFRCPQYDAFAKFGWVDPLRLIADDWIFTCDYCQDEITGREAKSWQKFGYCNLKCYNYGLDTMVALEDIQSKCHRKVLSLIHAAEDVRERFGKALCGSTECYRNQRNVVSTFEMPEYVFPVEFCHGCDTVIVQQIDKERWAKYQSRM